MHSGSICQLPLLRRLQFDITMIGKHAVVHAVPAAVQSAIHTGNFIEAVREACQRLNARRLPEEISEQLCAAFACRTAWRAGDVLDDGQLVQLVDAANTQRIAATCPHGRPTYVRLSMAELERRFLRFFPLDT